MAGGGGEESRGLTGIDAPRDLSRAPWSPLGMPLPPAPEPAAEVELHEDAVRRRILSVIGDPRALTALYQGLTATDLRERRLWWHLCLQMGLRVPKDGEATGGNQVKIVFNSRVPQPAHEDGPLGPLRVIEPER